MGLKYTPCAYHLDRIAVTTCRRCNQPICIENKKIYVKVRHRGSSEIGENILSFVNFVLSVIMPPNWKKIAKVSPFAIFGVILILSYEKSKNDTKRKAMEVKQDLYSFQDSNYYPYQEQSS